MYFNPLGSSIIKTLNCVPSCKPEGPLVPLNHCHLPHNIRHRVSAAENVFLYIGCLHVIKTFQCKVTSDVYLPHLATDRPSDALSRAVSSDEQQAAAAGAHALIHT